MERDRERERDGERQGERDGERRIYFHHHSTRGKILL